MATNKMYKVVIGNTAWEVSETDIKVIRAVLSHCMKLDEKVQTVSKNPTETTKVVDTYDWFQHFSIDGRKVALLFKESDYSFNKKSRMIKYRIKELGGKWSGDYDKQIFTWTFKTDDAVKKFTDTAKAGFPKEKA